MANTVVGFTIQIDGINTIGELNDEIKKTTAELKELDTTTEEYAETSEKLGKLKAEQAAIRKQQRETNKAFLEGTEALGAYDKASAKLNRLRKAYKNLVIEGKASTEEAKKLKSEIDELDSTLKKTDASVGQFQRSVGQYPRIFGLSTKALGQFIPGLDKLSERLDKITGGTNVLGKALFGAFAAVKIGQGISKLVGQLDEFIIAIDETRNGIASLTDATGDTLDDLTADVTALASTFGVEAEEITEAAAKIAKETGVSFEEALAQIENGLLAGQESNEEFLSSVAEYPELLNEVGQATGEYANRQRELLEANKEFAEAQVETANRLAGLNNQIKVFGQTAKAFLLNTLFQIIDFFKPVISAFVRAGQALGELVGSLFGFGSATKAAGKATELFGGIVQDLGKFLAFVVDGATFAIKSISAFAKLLSGDASQALALFTKEGAKAARANEILQETTEAITDEFLNETEGLNNLFAQLKETNAGSAERKELVDQLQEQYGEYLPNIDLETAGQQELAQAYNAAAEAIAEAAIQKAIAAKQAEIVEAQIDAELRLAQLQRQNAELALQAAKNTETLTGSVLEVGKAFLGGQSAVNKYTQAQVAANREIAAAQAEIDAQKLALEGLQDRIPSLTKDLSSIYNLDTLKANTDAGTTQVKDSLKDQKEAREKARKEQETAQKKLFEKLQRERQKFLEQELRFAEQQGQLLLTLQNRTAQLLTDAIQDEQEKARTIARQEFEKRKAQVEQQFSELLDKQAEREAEAVRLFGEGSEEVQRLRQQNAIVAEQTEQQLNDVLTRERIAFNNRLLDIDKRFEEQAQQQQQEAFRKRVDNVKKAEELALNEVEQLQAKGLLTEEEAAEKRFNIRKDAIEKEIQLIQQRQAVNERLAQAGIETSQEENEQLLRDKQFLYTELANLDSEYTQEVEANAQERAEQQKMLDEARLERLKADVQQAADIATQLLDIFDGFLSASSERQLARIEEREQANQQELQQLDERLQNATGLERQFLEQQVAANKQAADQIAKDKEAAERKRAKQDKARAIIESIIATALAVIQALPNVPLSIFAGLTGAAATATIAAQPLAKGGVVGISDEVVQFANGGKVTNRGNIKPLSNGDNVLATLKTGEVVLNQKQQRKIGYRALKAANIPNFANGGVVGAPTSLLQTSTDAVADEKMRLELLEKNLVATNERFDRIQVVWTANTETQAEEGRQDKKEIQANSQF